MTDYILVFITASSENEGEKIAAALVKERLAACVNVLGGMKSTFRWKGQVSAE
jgi:periplasmic divalent cation tolerance protein